MATDRNEFTAQVLETLAYTAGIVITALIWPPAAKAVGSLAMAYVRYGKEEKWRYRDQVKRTIKRLERRGFVVTETKGEQLVVTITQLGKKWFNRYQINRMTIKRLTQWDGLWRVVVFDIPENQHQKRDVVRSWLKRLGFARIQQSVWVIPWPCSEQFDALSTEYSLGHQAFLLETKIIAKERALKRHFRIH